VGHHRVCLRLCHRLSAEFLRSLAVWYPWGCHGASGLDWKVAEPRFRAKRLPSGTGFESLCVSRVLQKYHSRPYIAGKPPVEPKHRSCNPESSFHPCVGPAETTGHAFFVDVAPPGLPLLRVVHHEQPDHPKHQCAISDPKSRDYDQVNDGSAETGVFLFLIRDPCQHCMKCRGAGPYYPACTTYAR